MFQLPLAFGLTVLRGLALTLSLQGKRREADSLFLLAQGVESGHNVDAQMAKVAEALKTGNSRSWDEIFTEIDGLREQLHAPFGGGAAGLDVPVAGGLDRPEILR